MKTGPFFLACWLLLVGWGATSSFAQADSGKFVTVEAGELPIILSAPHGGSETIADVPLRQGAGVEKFKTVIDSRTSELTTQLADALERQVGKRPYVVIARFHRKYVDANRPAHGAYESEKARAAYDEYHRALASFRQEVEQRWGRGIVLDIHGQAAEPKAVIRGTQNGKTATHLVNRFGRDALTGEASLFGQLAKQDLSVIPAVGAKDREHDNYDGGFIVQTYGSSAGGTVDAIQLELGSELRSARNIPSTVDKLTAAIASFSQTYLPSQVQASTAVATAADVTKVQVGIYQDKGSGKSSERLTKALTQFKEVSIRELKADDIRSGALTELDVLIQPGGSGGAQGRNLGTEGRQAIRQFVREGGGYIGICAGAYLASADYDWSLNILDAKVIDRQHWARGMGMVEIDLTEKGQQVLQSKESQRTIYYGQGPLLAPANREEIADYQTLASYKTEIAKNGAPKGVMPGTTAIAQGQFGRGQVFCFSPHPELTPGLEVLLQHAIEQVKRKRNQELLPEASEAK